MNKDLLAFACVNSIITAVSFSVLISATGSTVTDFFRSALSNKKYTSNITAQQSHLLNFIIHFQPVIIMAALLCHKHFIIKLGHVLWCFATLLGYVALIGFSGVKWQYCIA